MDYRSAFAISAIGMSVEKLRVDVTATNLANMHSTRRADGSLFRPLRVVSQASVGAAGFGAGFDRLLRGDAAGAPAVRVEEAAVAPRQVYDPGHPEADAKGMVTLPGVDHLGEMANLSTALRAYQANVVAFNTAKSIALKALELGGGA